MIKYIQYSFVFILLILAAGCQKDTEEFTPIDSESVQASIFGIVVDKDENPIEGATVQFQGNTIYTDQYGIYKINDTEIDTRHNFLNINKVGYFEGSRTFRTNHTKTITLKTQLLEKDFSQSFLNDEGGVITKENTVLTFPANSIVVDATGAAYDGTVQVAVQYLDPTQLEVNQQMPGDLSGFSASNDISRLVSYGMVAVELQSPAGEKLQVKDGQTVNMTTTIPSEIVEGAPSEIPMWYFDMNTGFWKEEGMATLNGNQFEAEVTHFSWWNYDSDLPSIILSGRVVDQDGNPIAGIHVWAESINVWSAGHGDTDADGTFSGQAAKDETLILKIFANSGFCNLSNSIFESEIGPFSEDTDLGDIVIPTSEESTLSVTASFVNCENEPVTNGYVRIRYHYYEITDGTLDVDIQICNTDTDLELVAVDRDALKEANPILLNAPGENILGIITVCDNDVDFVEAICDELEYDFTLIEGVGLYNTSANGNPGTIKNMYANSSDTLDLAAFIYMNLSYDDGMVDEFVEGTFDLTGGQVGFKGNNNGNFYEFIEGQIMIDSYDPINELVRGSYTLKTSENGTTDEYDFYGDFRVPAKL